MFENISLQLIYSIPTWITIVNKVNHSSLFSALIGILNKSSSLFFSLHIKRKPVVVALISLSLLKIASSIQSNYIFSWVNCKKKVGSSNVESFTFKLSLIIDKKASVWGSSKDSFGNSFNWFLSTFFISMKSKEWSRCKQMIWQFFSFTDFTSFWLSSLRY